MHGLRMWSVAGLGLLASSNLIEAQSANSSQEEALAHHLDLYWSYGRSPPVYPSPQMSGTGDWAEAYQFAKDMVAKMTNNEKNNITYGQDAPNGCSGTTGSIPRLGFPGMCMNDAENGVRGQDGVNGYPSGIHVGASWNRALTLARAQYMGAEFKRKGVNVALGPVAGPLGRIARGGRNWEGFANDPYLSGRLIYETVRGMQENVIACVKHWIAYEQETNRVPPALNLSSFNASMSSNVDDKTMHETYMWPFADAVKAGVGSVMCVYNQINGSYGCQNSKTMNGLLKGELGFQGFVVTDWGAGYSGLASAQAGLDLYMPNSPFWQDGNLTLMVKNGSMAQSRLDDMATRIIATWYKHSRLDDPGNGMPVSLLEPHKLVDARDPMSSPVILQGGIEGHVLVKNERGALPLQKPQMLSLYGYDAIAAPRNMEYVSNGFNHWDLGLEGAQTIPGVGDFNITYIRSTFQSNESASNPLPNSAYNGTMYTGGGSGATTPAYIDAPFSAIQRQAMKDGTLLSWDFQSFNPTVNPATDACLVFINELASEGWDRPSLADDLSDELVKNVAANCSNTQVIIHNAGIRLVDSWIDHPNITAVVFAHLPGQDTGEALVQLLYGKQSFSGRLPYTVAKNESDYGLLLGPVVPDNTTEWHTQANFTEGNLIDYKHFIAQNITPRYAFGFGLTYTTFNYTDLQARVVTNISMLTPLRSRSNHASQDDPEAEGGDPALWDKVAEVRATITNSGSVAAAEVPQLYVQIPGGPAWQLRGFEKPYLRPGASATVQFPLLRRDLSSWNVTSQTWDLQRGRYPVFVGGNVLDQQLKGEITI